MQPVTTPMLLHTPVLLVIFNRPETTTLVFEAIRQARPPRLYIAVDGLRPEGRTDVERHETVERIKQNVDWDCQVKTLFQDKNLNSGVVTSSAVTWFFKQEEEGIILEDDCLPS